MLFYTNKPHGKQIVFFPRVFTDIFQIDFFSKRFKWHQEMRANWIHRLLICIRRQSLQQRSIILMIIVDYSIVDRRCKFEYPFERFRNECFRLIKSISGRLAGTMSQQTFLKNSIELVQISRVGDEQSIFFSSYRYSSGLCRSIHYSSIL